MSLFRLRLVEIQTRRRFRHLSKNVRVSVHGVPSARVGDRYGHRSYAAEIMADTSGPSEIDRYGATRNRNADRGIFRQNERDHNGRRGVANTAVEPSDGKSQPSLVVVQKAIRGHRRVYGTGGISIIRNRPVPIKINKNTQNTQQNKTK